MFSKTAELWQWCCPQGGSIGKINYPEQKLQMLSAYLSVLLPERKSERILLFWRKMHRKFRRIFPIILNTIPKKFLEKSLKKPIVSDVWKTTFTEIQKKL